VEGWEEDFEDEDFEEDFEAGWFARPDAQVFDAPLRCWVCHEESPACSEFCLYCEHSLAVPPRVGAGQWLGGRYEIVEPLGAGAMGWVLKARDHALGLLVALKVLRPEVAHNPRLAERFRSEVRLARKVRHRNVSGIHDYGEEDGLHYLSMEYVDGSDLKQILRRRTRPLPWSESYDIALQAACGLQAIHDAGILHRDIKTANITRDIRGIVRLMDFGIARERQPDAGGGLTAAWQIVGTPDYMSPEHARGVTLDVRSDVYSLGIVIYEVFTGRVPFHGNTPVATLLQHVECEVPLEGPDAAFIPRPLVAVLRRALAKQGRERYASAAVLASALERARSTSGDEPAFAAAWPTGHSSPDDVPTLMVPRLAHHVGMDPRACFSALHAALVHGDLQARVTAARALAELGSAARTAVPALVRALRDPSGPLRAQAAHALRRIGPLHAAGAVLYLLELLKDNRGFVREAAAEAIGCLTVPSPPPGLLADLADPN
jgi:hypothetical protein